MPAKRTPAKQPAQPNNRTAQKAPRRQKRPNRQPAVWHAAFLEALRNSGNVRVACNDAKIGRTTAYEHYHNDAAFRAAWDEALDDAGDLLEAEARRRALFGTKRSEPIIYQGKQVVDAQNRPIRREITEYSDTLMIFLLKGAKPEKYADRITHKHFFDLEAEAKKLAEETGAPVEACVVELQKWLQERDQRQRRA